MRRVQTITLEIREKVFEGVAKVPVELDGVTPDALCGKSADEIKEMRVWWGNRQEKLGDLFEVSVEGNAEKPDDVKIVCKGDFSVVKRVGEGMSAGEMIVEGNVGMHCGAMMSGGRIVVKGNAGCWAGREMRGGELIIEGDADDYLGAAYRGEMTGMTGGRIVVKGNAGDYVGYLCGGGEIIVEGNVGILAGLGMKGGRIVINGDAEAPGGEMTGGTLIVKGSIKDMLPSFRFESEEEIEGVKLKKYAGDLAMGKKAKGALYAP
ncbi:MAG: Formylmethanofuran dehydrogenase subunit C [Candidatus Alkanophagales archaeon MCA70_species_1]|nr:Formylmethanofuran dehydrogenase subunit C [Candidatus Alkanophaga volatiphilum]